MKAEYALYQTVTSSMTFSNLIYHKSPLPFTFWVFLCNFGTAKVIGTPKSPN